MAEGRVQPSIPIRAAGIVCVVALALFGQEQDKPAPVLPPQALPPPAVSKRILGIIPNYRTAPSLAQYHPLTAQGKFKIATQDSFDPGVFIITGMISGEAQLAHSIPSFGQESSGFLRYYGTTYGNLAIGNYMREGIYPTLLHQDPRYFRRGAGSGLSRVAYAVSQVFVARSDSGRSQFNFSEVLGSATAAAVSIAYYPGRRTAGNAASKMGIQLGIGAAGNILKEFWPDLDRMFRRKPLPTPGPPGG